jgi:predicted transglutaminase-like cysteine proteinase
MSGCISARSFAAGVAFLMALFGSPLAACAQWQVDMAALDSAAPPSLPAMVGEPFGLATAAVTGGAVTDKWSAVVAAIHAERDVLARCSADIAQCPPAAQKFLAVVAEGRAHSGRARIGIINRAINLAITPTSDMAQWGVPDHWSPPLETLSTGRGDCEDYAIAKYVALQEAGVDADDLRLVIVRDLSAGEDHAVVAVRLDGSWLMLDNRWLALVADAELQRMVPLFVLAGDGVRQFMPVLAQAERTTPAPSALGF